MSQRNRHGQSVRLGSQLADAVLSNRHAKAQTLARKLLEREERRNGRA